MIGWLLATAALANEYRFGLFVGNDEGLAGDPELVFAEADAAKMRDLFVEYGGIKATDAVLLEGAGAGAVQRAFEQLTGRIDALVTSGHEVVFVFYYSGHGDDEGLHLGPTRVEHENLRTWIDRVPAQVRIGLVDACQSGGLVRRKGGARGETFAFTEPEVEVSHGSAFITSSAASELSQESAEIGGGFFTHDLHTALSGAADSNRDGDVSLSEAYAWVHAETSFRTRDTPGAQTPHWDVDVSGAGEIVLTRLEEASARLSFQGDLEGAYSVWDESRKRYVAQVDGGAEVGVAVRPGVFYVHKRMPGWVEEARYTVRRGETHAVLAEDFLTVSYAAAASRGDLDRALRRAKVPDLSLRFVLGVKSFADADYFAPLAIGGIQGMVLGDRGPYTSFDVRTGASTGELLVSEDLPLVRSRQSAVSLSAAAGFATRKNLVRAGLGARATLLLLTRQFPDWDLERQAESVLGIGPTSWAGVHHGRFSVDLTFDWGLLVTRWDDRAGWPVTSDLALALGYRF